MNNQSKFFIAGLSWLGVLPAPCRPDAGYTNSPNTLVGHLHSGLFGPAAVGGRAGGAGVEDFANVNVQSSECFGSTFLGKAAHSYEPVRLQDFHYAPQVRIARGHKGPGLAGGQFVWRAVTAGIFHKSQRTMIDDKVVGKKFLGRAKAFAKKAPQPAAADFAAGAGQTVDGALGMFARGFADGGIDADPIANRSHLTKGHARLRHAEGAGVHAEEHNFLWGTAGQAKVLLVRGPRVVERVINVLHRLGEGERVAGGTQLASGSDDVIGGHGLAHSIGIFLKRKLNEINRTHRGTAYPV